MWLHIKECFGGLAKPTLSHLCLLYEWTNHWKDRNVCWRRFFSTADFAAVSMTGWRRRLVRASGKEMLHPSSPGGRCNVLMFLYVWLLSCLQVVFTPLETRVCAHFPLQQHLATPSRPWRAFWTFLSVRVRPLTAPETRLGLNDEFRDKSASVWGRSHGFWFVFTAHPIRFGGFLSVQLLVETRPTFNLFCSISSTLFFYRQLVLE